MKLPSETVSGVFVRVRQLQATGNLAWDPSHGVVAKWGAGETIPHLI